MAAREQFTVKQLIVEDLQFKTVAITVAAAATTGVSAADPDLVAGTIMGIVPTGNQDQFVDDIAVGATGVVTVTLAAAATADNTFNVTVWRDDESYF
jgi:hypothetical protein